jgi:hypothetical protein
MPAYPSRWRSHCTSTLAGAVRASRSRRCSGATKDVAQTLTTGLTQALSGMAVVVLTIFGVFSNVTDRRVAFMIQVEAYLERALAEEGPPASSADGKPLLDSLARALGNVLADPTVREKHRHDRHPGAHRRAGHGGIQSRSIGQARQCCQASLKLTPSRQ